MITKQSSIGIIGLGVLGGSYAQALSAAGYRSILGVDIDPDSIAWAKQQGWITEGTADSAAVQNCDLVICCLYPEVFVNWVRDNRKYFKKGMLLSDVTGVKRAVIDRVQELLDETVEFIACHPMAGRESKGIHYADANRFKNANFIIVPTASNSADAVETMRALAQDMGFKRISCLNAEEHDRMISYLSQLTHVIAVALMNADDNTHLAEFTGDSFRDLTRIARINEDMWPELFVLNKDYLIHDMDVFIAELQEFKALIAAEDIEGMRQKLIQSTARRAQFDKEA